MFHEVEDVPEYSIPDESQDEEIDEYEQMLSKVFRVSEKVRKHQIEVRAEEQQVVQVKTEPIYEQDFEALIDIQDNPITIKKEQIEIDGTCDIGEVIEICNIKTEPNDEQAQEVEDVPEYSIPDESQDEEIDEYEQMLSKVFRVSEKVRKHQIEVRAEEQQVVQVKTEPIDEQDFEALIDIQDNPITIKKEQIEIDGTCDIGEVIEICNIRTEPNDEQAQESETTDVSLTNICDERIRTAIKLEPEEQHLVEATDMKIMDTTTEQQHPTPTEIKPATKSKQYKVLIRLCPKTNTLKEKKYHIKTKKVDKKPQYLKLNKVKGVRLRKLYKCAKCGYENEHKLYRVHKNSKCQRSPNVDQFKTYKCTKCEASFSTLKLYLVHFHKHGYESLCCPSCNVKFESFKDLMPHFHKHVRQGYVNNWMIDKKLNVTSKRQHKCQTCHQKVELNDFFAHWESHLIINTPEINLEPKVALGECDNETISSDKVLKTPILHSVLQELQTQVCDRDCIVCFRKFSRSINYKRHLIEHLLMDAYVKRSSTRDSGLRCQICLREFATSEKYRFHMREHGNLPVYKCELCDITFSDSSNFAKHKKKHMLKVLICDICQKKFQAKFQLEKHILMHLESEPISCTQCDAKFYTQSSYKKHIRARHEHKSFKCVVCDVLFDSMRQKLDHAWKVHNERKHIADCLMCDEKFRKFQDLKSHSKAVHGEVEDVPEYSIPDESQDEEIDEYEQMLSKVFRVSEKVRKHQIEVRAEEQQVVQVKTEPIDEQDFEALIDIQDNPITIKKEQIEIDGTCDIGEVIEICNIRTEPNDEQAQESETTDVSLTNICDERIRTAIKLEPEEQHLVEATDMKIMDTTTEQQHPTPTEIKPATKSKQYKVLIRLCPKTNTLKEKKYHIKTKKVDKKPQYLKLNKVKGVRLRKLYKCAKCGYENEHKLYRVHKNSKCQRSPNVDQFKTYKCTKCEASFSTLKLYLVHFHKHGYESLCCPSCNVKFESFKDLMPHFHKHVRQGYVNNWMIDKKLNVTSKRQHKCQTCHQKVELNDFFAHWESHLIINTPEINLEPKVALGECDNETISSDKVLKTPILHSVLQELQTQVCDRDCIVCFRKFSRSINYKRHLIEHLLMDAYVKRSSTRDSGLRCQICLREFATSEKYRFHMREHGNLPVYKCELCDITFSDSSNFAKHKKKHMLKVLICDICQKKFQAKFQLEKHILMHLESEPISCTQCDAKFYTQSSYKKHMRARHEHKSFKCVVCDVLFDSMRQKLDHAWKVHNERKHIADCLMCDEKFRKFQDLKSHSKAVHGVSMSFYSVKKSKGKPGKIKDVSVLRQIRPKEPKSRRAGERQPSSKKRTAGSTRV